MRLIGLTAFLLIAWFYQITLKGYHLTGDAQGTTYHITYYAADSAVTTRQIDSILENIDSAMSLYKPYSQICRFNNAEKGCQIDGHFQVIIKKSIEITKTTNGISDITIEPLVQAWGFGVKRAETLPDAAQVKNMMLCVGSDKIHLNNGFLSKDKPCVHLDVNGIAQGYSVDVIADFLNAKGIHNFIVELGGELRVKGHKPTGEQISIGIEGPGNNDFDPLPIQRIVHIGDGALTTSGNYRKYYLSGGRRISHLIDARTGYPIQNELISVTVYAKDGITADGYDNALMGMGLKKAIDFVEHRSDMEAYFIYHKANGAVADTATRGFYKFMR